MAQPTQAYSINGATGGNITQSYCVIDNSAAPTFVTYNAGAHLGYDTISSGPGDINNNAGNISQGANLPSGANGTIPDFVNTQTFSTVLGYAKMIGFKNPA